VTKFIAVSGAFPAFLRSKLGKNSKKPEKEIKARSKGTISERIRNSSLALPKSGRGLDKKW